MPSSSNGCCIVTSAVNKDLKPGKHSAGRLRELERLRLLDAPVDSALDRLTRLASRLLDVPVALISLVDHDRQFFASQVGLPEPWCSRRQTPLSHSFCKHVVAEDQPLRVDDAQTHPLVCYNLAVTDLNVAAYLGFPLRSPSGAVLGSFCAIDTRPREWTDDERETLEELTELAMTEVALREMNIKLEERVAARTAEVARRGEMLREMTRQVTEVEQAERERLAGVLHDHLQQLLVACQFGVRRLADAQSAEDRAPAAKSLKDIVTEAIGVTRDLTADLSPPGLACGDLDTALPWLAEQFERRHGLCVDLQGDAGTLDKTRAPIVFVAVRELLFNTVKHAGVETAIVHCRREDGHLAITVEDCGVGIGEAEGFGLNSLRERLAGIGGRFEHGTRPGGGARCTLIVPLGQPRP